MSRPSFTYWNPDPLSPAELEALKKLDETRDPAQRLEAFDLLAASSSPRAQAQALDQFVHKARLGRFGAANAVEARRPEILARARQWLREPPLLETLPDGRAVQGANHATALAVLSIAGEASDLDAIAPLLRSSDVSVQEAAVLAAAKCVTGASALPADLVTRLTEIAGAAQTPKQTRVLAVGALRSVPGAESEQALVQLAEACDPPVGPHAAQALARRDLPRYRAMISALLGKWPADAGYPIDDLRDLIAANP